MRSFFVLFMATAIFGEDEGSFICTSGRSICIPKNYSKYDLPETKTKVSLGIDIMDIPNIDDNNFSVTFIAYLDIVWKDPRLIMTSVLLIHQRKSGFLCEWMKASSMSCGCLTC